LTLRVSHKELTPNLLSSINTVNREISSMIVFSATPAMLAFSNLMVSQKGQPVQSGRVAAFFDK
jgi:hypothetical protein